MRTASLVIRRKREPDLDNVSVKQRHTTSAVSGSLVTEGYIVVYTLSDQSKHCIAMLFGITVQAAVSIS